MVLLAHEEQRFGRAWRDAEDEPFVLVHDALGARARVGRQGHAHAALRRALEVLALVLEERSHACAEDRDRTEGLQQDGAMRRQVEAREQDRRSRQRSRVP